MIRPVPISALLIAVAVTGILPLDALAADSGKTAIAVENPTVRVTIPGRPAAGYMVVRNTGTQGDTLVSAMSPKANRVEFHTHLMENGVMKMRQVNEVEVPAGGSAPFAPGGHHLMIFGLKPQVKPGTSLPMTLNFSKAGAVSAEFQVEGLARSGAPGPPHNHRQQ